MEAACQSDLNSTKSLRTLNRLMDQAFTSVMRVSYLWTAQNNLSLFTEISNCMPEGQRGGPRLEAEGGLKQEPKLSLQVIRETRVHVRCLEGVNKQSI